MPRTVYISLGLKYTSARFGSWPKEREADALLEIVVNDDEAVGKSPELLPEDRREALGCIDVHLKT